VALCFFVSDLHGREDRYEKLFAAIASERPDAVLIGGDLLAHALSRRKPGDFVGAFLRSRLEELRRRLGEAYPRVLVILGNDDPRCEADGLGELAAEGLLADLHMGRTTIATFDVFGYACVPPTPFLLKDWERWDVSRHLEPGCVSPEEGYRTVPADPSDVRYGTIARDLAILAGEASLEHAVMLFHAPPHATMLDRAALDGQRVDYVPLDPHLGSIAIRRFIEERQPLVSLHGHVHESARLTGAWQDQIGRTHLFSAAHDGPELALVRLDLEHPASTTRDLI